MPAAFMGHGNPMNALEHNRYAAAWRSFALDAPKPRAILAVSAHWYVNITAVTAMAKPRTIHDFYGFPQELFDVQYPAAGDPELAAEVAELVKPTYVGLDSDSWGLDHGTWSVLVHMFPEADVPVVQLSVHADQPLSYHLELGEALAPLRERDVMVVASGNVVHNLGMVDWSQPGRGADWGVRFDEAVRDIVVNDPGALGQVEQLPEYRLAVPTPDHFLPLAYLAGMAKAEGRGLSTIIEGYDVGSLSMTSFALS